MWELGRAHFGAIPAVVPRLSLLQQSASLVGKYRRIERLRNDGQSTFLKKSLDVCRLSFRRDESEGNMSRASVGSQFYAGLGPVEPRHHDVEQYEVRLPARRYYQRLASRSALADFKTPIHLERHDSYLAQIRFVIDIKYLQRHLFQPSCLLSGKHTSKVAPLALVPASEISP